MKKALFLGAIFVLGVSGLIAQTPPPKPAAPKANEPKKADAKPQAKDEFVEAVNAALQSHPDIKAAEAEVRLAQAKLDQVKLKVTQQINALKQARDEAMLEVDLTKAMLETQERLLVEKRKFYEELSQLNNDKQTKIEGSIQLQKQHHDYAEKSTIAATKIKKLMAEIARLDSEIRSYRNAARLEQIKNPPKFTIGRASDDKLMMALQKKVKFGPVENLPVQEMFEDLVMVADLNIKVRTADAKLSISLPAGEMSIGAWFDLILDQIEIQTTNRHELYVREYGLLLGAKNEAPSDAFSLSKFKDILHRDH